MDMLSYFLGRLAGGGTGGSGGSDGPIYTDLKYNEDGTFTFFDEEGNEHTAECEYVDGRLEKIVFDGVTMDAVYEEGTDKLIKFGDMDIIVDNYSGSASIEPLDHTVTFLADGKPYEIVSVTDGNKVNAPSGTPTSENGLFVAWQESGARVNFPYPPTKDVEINALFVKSLADKIYTYYGIDKNVYPYVFLGYSSHYDHARIIFSEKVKKDQINVYAPDTYRFCDPVTIIDADFPADYNDIEAIINFFLKNVDSVPYTSTGACTVFNSYTYTVWTNADVYQGAEGNTVYHFI
jgi:hypothetical protein